MWPFSMKQMFVTALVQSFFHLELVGSGDEIPRNTYPPPLLVQDLTILHEAFLI